MLPLIDSEAKQMIILLFIAARRELANRLRFPATHQTIIAPALGPTSCRKSRGSVKTDGDAHAPTRVRLGSCSLVISGRKRWRSYDFSFGP